MGKQEKDGSLGQFDHNDLFNYLDEQRAGELPSEEIVGNFLNSLKTFHSLSLRERWNIYAQGGYEHGVENMLPYIETQKTILNKLNLRKDSNLAVLGTGTGPLEREFFAQGLEVNSITAFDADPGMMEIHTRRFGERVNEVTQNLNEPIEKPDVVEDDFDRFTVVNTLEFLNIPVFLKNLKDVLKGDAKGVIVTPNENTRTSLPILKTHLEMSNREVSGEVWEEISGLASQLWDEIFNEEGFIDTSKLDTPKVERFVELYSVILGMVVDSMADRFEGEELALVQKQVYVTGLANVFPPVKPSIKPFNELCGLIEDAGFEIVEQEDVNNGFSKLLVLENKD